VTPAVAEDAQLASIFAPGGPLSRSIADYRARGQQRAMAERITRTIRECRTLVVEAGTGTGKTVAYLVPALLAGGKVIISTGTKTLQDQLFHRDLPTVRAALGLPASTALLKGRANYVCRYHLARNLGEARLPTREAARDLHSIDRFAARSASGDKAELAAVAEDSPAWAAATSTRDSCLGGKCPDFADCFLVKARREALAADIVVVNHHLFFADLVLRDEGLAELLPACNTIILDEAHQLPAIASDFFGTTVSTGQILDLCRDALVEARLGAPEVRELPDLVRRLERAARDLRLAAGAREARLPARALEGEASFASALAALRGELKSSGAALERLAERSEGLANCAGRAVELAARVERWTTDEDGELVRWVEVYTHAAALHMTPLSIAASFRRQLDGPPRAWILTSATLAVGGDFSHYKHELGLEDADSACWDSPFDYAANALLYVPSALPLPNSPEHTDAVIDAAVPVLRASRGRAFLLFTSLRAMRRAHERLARALHEERIDLPLLLQGEGSRSELLERFRRLGNAVLVASASFWEGVDVRGEALSVVVIDKLPFAPPDDPVLAARLEHLRRLGRNPFVEHQLPQAAIALKQGAGRLIRDERDRGVLVLCDPRLVSKPYGRQLLDSLPPMRRTRSLAEVEAFLRSARIAAIPEERP
jgi:ATP-dependent DNA helicase DinG